MTDELVWERLKSEAGPNIILFDVRYDTMRHPQSGEEFRRLVLEAPDWVNVVAVTPDRETIIVEQYRFGIGDTTFEPPAGLSHAVVATQDSRDEQKTLIGHGSFLPRHDTSPSREGVNHVPGLECK